MTKNESIKQSILETKNKRKQQDCRVYEVKVDKSHLSKIQLKHLNMLFLESKWLYNHILSQSSEDLFSYNIKNDNVTVLNKNKEPENRILKYLSSQERQGIRDRIKQNIVNLSKAKKKGIEIGELHFRSYINSIDLFQYNNTYKIKNDNYVKVQGIKKSIKVIGLKQIPKEAEFASATLLRKAKDYYLHITCFLPKEEKVFPYKSVGIDFGIKDTLTLSNGDKCKISFPITNDIKKLQKQFKNKVKYSKNWNKLKFKIQKKFDKLSNKKADARHKIVSEIINNNEIICIQDENIKGWHEGYFGKQVQCSILGGIMSDLKHKSHTLSIVDKWFPSTKLCPKCLKLNEISLDQRIFHCRYCEYIEDRDTHSAINILNEGLRKISTERTNTIPVENKTSISRFSNELDTSLFYEAGSCDALAHSSSHILSNHV